jgi:hypothetical protein
MLYKAPQPMDRSEAERIFAGHDESAICNALVSVAFYEPDWKWVQALCLRFLETPGTSKGVRSLAATCLEHLARIHRIIDLDIVVPLLESLRDDPEMGTAEDALDDIRVFITDKDT